MISVSPGTRTTLITIISKHGESHRFVSVDGLHLDFLIILFGVILHLVEISSEQAYLVVIYLQ